MPKARIAVEWMQKVRGFEISTRNITDICNAQKCLLIGTRWAATHRNLCNWFYAKHETAFPNTSPSMTRVSTILLRLIAPLSITYLLSTSSRSSFSITLPPSSKLHFTRPSTYPGASDLHRQPHLMCPHFRETPLFMLCIIFRTNKLFF